MTIEGLIARLQYAIYLTNPRCGTGFLELGGTNFGRGSRDGSPPAGSRDRTRGGVWGEAEETLQIGKKYFVRYMWFQNDETVTLSERGGSLKFSPRICVDLTGAADRGWGGGGPDPLSLRSAPRLTEPTSDTIAWKATKNYDIAQSHF